MNKCCTKCLEFKDISEFYVGPKGLPRAKCKICQGNAQDKKLAKNSKLLKAYGITLEHGITLEQYDLLCQGYDNKCAICNKPESILDKRSKKIRKLAVDDEHSTGIVRGVLCSKCNRGLGMFDDNPENLNNALSYLASYKEAVEEQNAINSR